MIRKRNKKSNSGDQGYIVVETVGAFIPFMLLVISILSLVNIITLQVRMHYALTQAAGTMSMYCYVLEATGAADGLSQMDIKGSEFSSAMDDILKGIGALSPGGKGGDTDIRRAFDAAQTAVGDPVRMIQNFANYSLNDIRSTATAKLAEPLVLRYLLNGEESPGEYFRRVRIEKFRISECTIIDGSENVKLTAEYEVEYTFGALRLPISPTLKMTQTVVTKAWLGGSGEGYIWQQEY